MPNAASKRYTLAANFIRTTADKSVQLLLGQLPGLQVMPPGTDEDSRRLAERMEAVLYHCWDLNEAPIVLRRVAFNMILLRRGLVYHWWDATAKRPRFRSIAPDNFYPVYDGEEIVECIVVSRRLTRALKRQYPKQAADITSDDAASDVFDEERWGQQWGGGSGDDVLNQRSAGSTGRQQQQSMTGLTTVIDYFDKYGAHVRVMGDAVHTQRLGYLEGRVPVIEFPYNVPGDEREPVSEVDDIIDLNLYLDDLLSDAANVVRKYAHPTILDKHSGVAPEVIARNIQKEGGVIPIRQDGDIEFLNWQGVPADFVNQYNRVMGLIDDLSGKPRAAYGQLETNQSGVATNMALSPTTAMTEERQSIFGFYLERLNAAIFDMYEFFMKGEIEVRGSKPKRPGVKATAYFEEKLRGAEMDGWRKNRIRWPSALRTDDPVYVQNEIAKAQSQPTIQSVYTTAENLGIEDVEMEMDLVKEQLADPRFHPDRLTAAAGAAKTLSDSALPDGLGGIDPSLGGGALDDEAIDTNVRAAGSPHAEQISSTGY